MKRVYESMVILESDLSDQAREEIFSKMTKRIEELGGKVLGSRVWAKDRAFCYPIKSRGAEKKRNFNGCYWLVDFSLDIENLGGLKETIRLEERVLRNVIIRKEKAESLSISIG